MKKIWMMGTLVLAGAMACSATFAGTATTSAGELGSAVSAGVDKHVPHAAKTSKARPAFAKRKFLYLDMVAHKHPSSIRNAVIVYDHALMKKKSCNSQDQASVSECLTG